MPALHHPIWAVSSAGRLSTCAVGRRPDLVAVPVSYNYDDDSGAKRSCKDPGAVDGLRPRLGRPSIPAEFAP